MWAASIRPSLLTATLYLKMVGCRFPVIRQSSSLDNRAATGRSRSLATIAATAAGKTLWLLFPPKPPPRRFVWDFMNQWGWLQSHLYDHFIAGNSEYRSSLILNVALSLCGRVDNHMVVFLRNSPSWLWFHIHVLLNYPSFYKQSRLPVRLWKPLLPELVFH